MGPPLLRSEEGRTETRPMWEDFTTQGLKMMRGVSKWQLPILTVADRGGARLFRRLPNRKGVTLERHEAAGSEQGRPMFRLCRRLQERRSSRRSRALRGRQQAWHALSLRLLSHPERELAPRPLQKVHQALLRTDHEEPKWLHPLAGGAAGVYAPDGDCARIVNQVSCRGMLRAQSE